MAFKTYVSHATASKRVRDYRRTLATLSPATQAMVDRYFVDVAPHGFGLYAAHVALKDGRVLVCKPAPKVSA